MKTRKKENPSQVFGMVEEEKKIYISDAPMDDDGFGWSLLSHLPLLSCQGEQNSRDEDFTFFCQRKEILGVKFALFEVRGEEERFFFLRLVAERQKVSCPFKKIALKAERYTLLKSKLPH